MPYNQNEVYLYTDGACSGNPGPGGWAYILKHPATGKEKRASGAERFTTNNKMEISAVIEGLKAVHPAKPGQPKWKVHVVTDSSYLEQGITTWIHAWKRNGWKRKTRNGFEPVKNQELWQELDQLVQIHDVTFERVRGHAGHEENEECDEMAVNAYRELMMKV